jgi:hypothetical protein
MFFLVVTHDREAGTTYQFETMRNIGAVEFQTRTTRFTIVAKSLVHALLISQLDLPILDVRVVFVVMSNRTEALGESLGTDVRHPAVEHQLDADVSVYESKKGKQECQSQTVH